METTTTATTRRFAAVVPSKTEFGSLASAKEELLIKVSRTGREHFVADQYGAPLYAARRIRGRLVTENLVTGTFGVARVRP